MPDDFTFDDDDLMPDDLRDEVDQPSGDDAESAPPWAVLPGDAPPAPDAPADVAPPWSALPGEPPPAPAAPAADAPWGEPVSATPSAAQDVEDEHTDLDFLFDDDSEDALAEIASAAPASDEPVDIDWLFDDADDDTGDDSRETDPEAQSFAALDDSGGVPDDTFDDDVLGFDFEDELDESVTSDSAEAEPPETVPDWVLAGYASAEEAAKAQRDEDEQTPPRSAAPEWLHPAIAAYEAGEDLVFNFDDEEDRSDRAEPKVVPEWVASAASAADDDATDDDLVFDFDDEPDEQAAAVPEWVAAAAAQVAEDGAIEADDDEIETVEQRGDETVPDWVQMDDEPEPERPVIRRIEVDDGARLPDWVRDPTAEPGEDIPEGLTYDEWEALMDERERAAQEPLTPVAAPDDMTQVAPPVPGMPEPPMLDFAAADEPPAADTDIPDWAKTTSFDADPFTQPFEIRASEPDTSAEPGDLPDWMTGDSAPDMDWNALFGAPAPEPPEAGDTKPLSEPQIRHIPTGDTGQLAAGLDADWLDEDDADADAAREDDLTAEPQIRRIPTGDTGQLAAGLDANWLEEDDANDGGDDDEIRSLDDMFAEPDDAPGDEGEREDESREPAEMPDWFAEMAPLADDAGDGGDDDEIRSLDDMFAEPDDAPGDEGEREDESLEPAEMPDWFAEMTPLADDVGDGGDDDEIRSLDDMFAEPDDAPGDEGEREDESREPAEMPDWFAEMAPLADDAGDGGDDDEIRSLDDMFAEPDDAPGDEGERDDESREPAEMPDWFAEMAPLADDVGDGGDDDEIRSLDDMFAEPDDAPDDAPGDEGERDDESLEPAEMPDWFAEMAPLADDAGDGGDDDEIRSLDDMFAEPDDAPDDEGEREDESREPAEMPDWFADEGIDDAVPGPEDIPFPDLELDDTMPQGAWEAFEKRAQARADAEAAGGDFVERFDPLEPDEFPAADQPEPSALPRDEALPDWIIDSALPDDAGLPDDLSADSIWTMDMIPDQPIPGVAEDNLDWLDDISPDDVAAQDVGESLPPLPDIADIVPVEDEDDLLRTAPLDSSALDELLSTSALTVHEPQMPARAGEPDVDFDALFNELPDDTDAEALFAGAGTTQLEAWFAGEEDDAALLEAQAAEGRVDTPDEFAALLQDTAREAPDTEAAEPSSRLGRFRLGRKRDKEPAAEEAVATGAVDQGDTGLETPELPEPEPLTAEPQPEWVEELRPVDLPVTVKAGGVQADFKQKHIADLPDRLRAFREAALSDLVPLDKLPPADDGPLAGIAGALPLPDILLSGEVTYAAAAGLVITAQQQARADRLQALLDAVADDEAESERAAGEPSGLGLLEVTEPDEQPQVVVAPKAPPPERRHKRRKLDRWLVMLIMLAALVGPFITDALHVADDAPALSGTRRQVAGAVARVRPGDYVLFAFEYGPPTARELDALADAVLRDVLARRAIPITLSTNPAGALHAETVVTALAGDAALLTARDNEESALTWGEDYVILGYLPGEAVGVRALSTPHDTLYAPHSVFDYDLRGDETGLSAIALDRDIALLVVIGDESDDVRTWVEQLSDVTVRKVALVTAAIEPLTTPYVYADGGYAGYLAGARDAYSYNAARNANNRTPYAMPDNAPDIPNPEQSRWQSMALGALLAALVIGSGLFINLLRGLLRRRHR